MIFFCTFSRKKKEFLPVNNIFRVEIVHAKWHLLQNIDDGAKLEFDTRFWKHNFLKIFFEISKFKNNIWIDFCTIFIEKILEKFWKFTKHFFFNFRSKFMFSTLFHGKIWFF